jgi:hypothetical protein
MWVNVKPFRKREKSESRVMGKMEEWKNRADKKRKRERGK